MNIFQNILPYGKFGSSRAINAENPMGEKGKGGMAASGLGIGRKGSPCLQNIQPDSTTVLADISGCGVINHIWITVDNKTTAGDCFVLRDLILRMTWDDAENPAVEVPLGDFFCCGFGKECLVNSYPIVVAPSRGLNSYFSMPFKKRAKIELINQHKNPIPAFFYQIDYCLYDSLPDPVYLDGDKEFPTICGTGMEDYVGGSWSFAKANQEKMTEQTYSTLFLGYPYYSNHDDLTVHPYHNDDCPPMRGMYRFHIPDPVYFQEDIRVTVQQIGMSHNGLFERQDDVSSVAYWYQEENVANEYCPLPPKEERWPR